MRPAYLTNPEPIIAPGDYLHYASGMKFPATVGDFQRVQILRYDRDSLDVSAGYDRQVNPGLIEATVYVYPAPHLVSIASPPNVIAGTRMDLTQVEFERRKSEVLHAHPDAKLIEEEDLTLSKNSQSNYGKLAVFDYEDRFAGMSTRLHSYLYVFCYVNNKWAIEYRFTFTADVNGTPKIQEFLQNLDWPKLD
jgi:hypothetical protein